MTFRYLVAAVCLASLGMTAAAADGKSNLYLVKGTGGPGFAASAEVLAVLENGILPMFDALQKHMADGRIVAGGLPVGDRAFVMIVRAGSHAEVDEMLRDLPAWGVLEWKVVPLQAFSDRAAKERRVVADLKRQLRE